MFQQLIKNLRKRAKEEGGLAEIVRTFYEFFVIKFIYNRLRAQLFDAYHITPLLVLTKKFLAILFWRASKVCLAQSPRPF